MAKKRLRKKDNTPIITAGVLLGILSVFFLMGMGNEGLVFFASLFTVVYLTMFIFFRWWK